jgi:hypothetical protein
MYQLLPITLDLDKHLLLHPPRQVPSFKRDELLQLLSLVTELPARNRKLARRVRERGGFVPISAHRVQQTVRNYHHYLAYAVQTGLLETDGHYRPASPTQRGKCTGYRFPAAYRERPLGEGLTGTGQPRMQLVLIGDKKFAAKVRAHRRRSQHQLSSAERLRYRAHQHLLEWLESATTPFRIDQQAALQAAATEWARQQADPSLRRVKSAGWKRRWVKAKDGEQFVDPAEQYNQRVNTIVRLAGRELNPVLDQVGGRLHSTLTNMSSVLRPYVYAEGQAQLVSLDLANSQPYLLNLLLNPAFYSPALRGPNFRRGGQGWEKEGKGIRREVRERYKKEGKDADFMLVKILQEADQQEIEKFRQWTSSGQFYQRLREAMAELGEEEARLAAAPGAVKELIFLVLFSKNRYSTPGKRAFATLFPTVDKVVRLLKKGDHTTLPRLLQTLEAHLLLQRIGRQVTKALPQVPILTIHDSLVVPLPYADQVQRLMEQELANQVGLPPCIKRELWSQQVSTMHRDSAVVEHLKLVT